jgi:protein associated with RNAse G/E
VRAEDGLVITRTPAGLEVETSRGPWNSSWDTHGHYWADRWYNVIRLDNPNGGGLFGFYCNIATPVEFDGETVHYIDLELDVRAFLQPDGSLPYTVVDEDEFLAAVPSFQYPEDLIRAARAAVDEVIALIEARAFPFDIR